ncbi:hypothetical protein GJ496_004875 [Pomphorhynchus laevis]|nr:hypothetical protein GJ496_004875 [Pomphorhynchus laevis]
MKNHLDRLQTNLRNSVSLRMTTANIEEIGIKLKKSGPVEKLGDICQQLIPQIKSNLDQRGFVIQEDGGSIVASVPELTTDRRNELLKLTKTWYDRIVVDMKTDLNKFVKQVRIAEKNCQKDFIRNVEETLKYRFKSVTEIAENMKNEKCNQIQGKYTN